MQPLDRAIVRVNDHRLLHPDIESVHQIEREVKLFVEYYQSNDDVTADHSIVDIFLEIDA